MEDELLWELYKIKSFISLLTHLDRDTDVEDINLIASEFLTKLESVCNSVEKEISNKSENS